MSNEKAKHTPGPLSAIDDIREAIRITQAALFKCSPYDNGDIELRNAAIDALNKAEHIMRDSGPIYSMAIALILIAERSPKLSQQGIEARAAIAEGEQWK